MKAANVLAWAAAILFGALVLINRAILIAPTELSLGVARVSAPLGLVLLMFGGALTAVFAAYLLKVHINALSVTRKHAVEVRRHRELAETAELSRYTELRQYLERELGSLGQAQQVSAQHLQEQIITATNTLAAYIGELDDRMARQWPTPPEQHP